MKVILDFNINKASKFKKLLIRDHCKTNIKGLKQFLKENSDYQAILESSNVNEAAEGLNSHIQYYYDKFCPIKQINCHSDYLKGDYFRRLIFSLEIIFVGYNFRR